MTMARRILIVDDEQGIRAALGQLLEFEGYEVRAVGNAVDGLAEYAKQRPDLVFLDVKMAGIDGVEALKKIKEIDPSAIVVMISGHATIQTAVEATQLGAYDILEKPLDTDRILVTLRNALQHLDLHEENARLRETIQSRYEIVGQVVRHPRRDRQDRARGQDAGARADHRRERHRARSSSRARIHAQSTRADEPFVEVNCAAIPSELIESELFGHMKGSFTGAVADRAGQVRAGAWRHALSRRSRRHEPRGAGQSAARAAGRRRDAHWRREADRGRRPRARRDEQEPRGGDRRGPVSARTCSIGLNVVPIHVPPLRERREDIPLLVAHFVNVLTQSRGRRAAGASRRRPSSGSSHLDWPGNVRELRNTIERLLILAAGPAHHGEDVARLVGQARSRAGGTGLAPRLQDVRGVQARGGARVPARQAARVRLERVGNGARARHAALEPVQEDRALRTQPRETVS